jgi:hypothetical protein
MIPCIRVGLFTAVESALCFRISRLVLFNYCKIGISCLHCRGAYGELNFPLLGEMRWAG